MEPGNLKTYSLATKISELKNRTVVKIPKFIEVKRVTLKNKFSTTTSNFSLLCNKMLTSQELHAPRDERTHVN